MIFCSALLIRYWETNLRYLGGGFFFVCPILGYHTGTWVKLGWCSVSYLYILDKYHMILVPVVVSRVLLDWVA